MRIQALKCRVANDKSYMWVVLSFDCIRNGDQDRTCCHRVSPRVVCAVSSQMSNRACVWALCKEWRSPNVDVHVALFYVKGEFINVVQHRMETTRQHVAKCSQLVVQGCAEAIGISSSLC